MKKSKLWSVASSVHSVPFQQHCRFYALTVSAQVRLSLRFIATILRIWKRGPGSKELHLGMHFVGAPCAFAQWCIWQENEAHSYLLTPCAGPYWRYALILSSTISNTATLIYARIRWHLSHSRKCSAVPRTHDHTWAVWSHDDVPHKSGQRKWAISYGYTMIARDVCHGAMQNHDTSHVQYFRILQNLWATFI